MAFYEPVEHGSPNFPIRVHETYCPHGFTLYPHLHAEFEFLVLEQGSGRLYVDGVGYPIRAGEGAFINAQSIHLGQPDSREPVSFFALVFSPRIFGSSPGDLVTDKYVTPVVHRSLRLPLVCTPSIPWQAQVLETARTLHACKEGEFGGELEVKSLLFHLWGLLCAHGEQTREEEGSLSQLREVMELMDREYASHLTLADLAATAHMSESHFCRSFSAITHSTPFVYLQQVRIQKSCQYLLNTDLSISRIAVSCGFNDLSYYARCFRRLLGLTPSQYRKNNRRK